MGTWKGSSRIKLYDELGWESLENRRISRRILQVHKIVTNKTPSYLRDKLPPNRRNLIHLPRLFQEVRGRTCRYMNSFFPNATATWNNTLCLFENFPTFDMLKKRIFTFIRPKPKSIFGIHNPASMRYVFQLRVGLSQLRSHKKQHNFLDTPSDICLCKQGKEDTCHFLLHCPFYTSHRETLWKCVNDILGSNNIISNDYVQLYLYGHSLLSDTANRSILNATINFIDRTNRFSN